MKQFHSYISTLILVATTPMGSCTTDDSPSNPAVTNTIAFSAHVENLHTRAEKTGCMDYLTLSKTGFGVFGYNSAKSIYTTSLSPEEEFCGTQVDYTGTEEQAKEAAEAAEKAAAGDAEKAGADALMEKQRNPHGLIRSTVSNKPEDTVLPEETMAAFEKEINAFYGIRNGYEEI